MASMALAETYGEAIFDIAKEQNILEQMEQDLLYVQGLFNTLSDLRGYIESPIVEKQHKIELLQKIFAEAIHKMAVQFLYIMVQRDRESSIVAAITDFVSRSRADRGVVSAKVFTARQISAEMQEKITQRLREEMGKEVLMQSFVKPELLGGLVIEIGDKRYDTSVARRLKDLEDSLREGRISTNKIGVNESV